MDRSRLTNLDRSRFEKERTHYFTRLKWQTQHNWQEWALTGQCWSRTTRDRPRREPSMGHTAVILFHMIKVTNTT